MDRGPAGLAFRRTFRRFRRIVPRILQTVLQNHELWQRVNSLKYLTWEVFVRRSFHRGTWVQCADATGNELLRQEREQRTTSLANAIEKECGPAPRF
ncbi:MAG: hypothetical protein RLZZ515_1862 [Cyanobacteriota bacterium]